MAFFNSAITVLQTQVVALGAGLGLWGAINLLEGYGNDNPGAKSQGMKQLMAGGGVALIRDLFPFPITLIYGYFSSVMMSLSWTDRISASRIPVENKTSMINRSRIPTFVCSG